MPSAKPPVARWRSTPKAKGLARVGQGPTGIQLREGTTVIIQVVPKYAYPYRTREGWYWYGLGQNTCNSPCATIEEAKAEASAFYKTHKAAKAGDTQ